MTISITQMRQNVYDKYPGERWKRRVNDMSDQQVVAVYYRMQNSKKAGS